MITKEEIEAALNAYYGNDVEHGWMAREQMEAALTAAFAAMPAPAVKVKPLVPTQRVDQIVGAADPTEDEAHDMAVELMNWRRAALTPAPDLASENERLRKALEFVQLWAWRDDPPNAARNLSDSERLSAIKYHPSILPGRAALERT
jgi:hypothetical protein